MKKYLKISLCVLVVLVFSGIIGKHVSDKRYFSGYDPSPPLSATIMSSAPVEEEADLFGVPRARRYTRVEFTYDTAPGESVPALLTLPLEQEGPFPVIVFLHGIGQSKSFLEDICTPYNEAGFAMASFDQYTRGGRKVQGNFLKQAVAFRQRPRKTVLDTRRLIDYLQTRDDIDRDRVYLVGASYGAITGCTAVALEKRIRAAVLVVGGGNLPVMLDAPVLREEANSSLYGLIKPVVCYFLKPADPIYYAAQTAPTPLLFLNGETDRMVTPESARALYEKAGEPKEIRWYPCNHPGLVEDEGPIVVNMLDDALAWLKEQDQGATASATL